MLDKRMKISKFSLELRVYACRSTGCFNAAGASDLSCRRYINLFGVEIQTLSLMFLIR